MAAGIPSMRCVILPWRRGGAVIGGAPRPPDTKGSGAPLAWTPLPMSSGPRGGRSARWYAVCPPLRGPAMAQATAQHRPLRPSARPGRPLHAHDGHLGGQLRDGVDGRGTTGSEARRLHERVHDVGAGRLDEREDDVSAGVHPNCPASRPVRLGEGHELPEGFTDRSRVLHRAEGVALGRVGMHHHVEYRTLLLRRGRQGDRMETWTTTIRVAHSIRAVVP